MQHLRTLIKGCIQLENNYFVLSFPNFENEDLFNHWNNFRNISRMIIVCLCLINLHLFYFNLYN